MRVVLLAVLVFVLACSPTPPVAHAQTQVTRAGLESMLAGFEDVPSLAEWRALGPDAVPLLIAIHDDPQVMQPVRLRAVEAMAAFSTPAARTFLLRVMNDPREGRIVVREAAESLAVVAGADAVAPIARLLESTDRDVREGGIRALGRIAAPSARQALEAQAARETDADLRTQLAALLAR